MRRTQAELNNPEYNYFLAFGIDPKERNANAIAKAIESGLYSIRGSAYASRLAELREDVLEVMCNDSVFASGEYLPKRGGRNAEANKAKYFKMQAAIDTVKDLCAARGENAEIRMCELVCIYDIANSLFDYFNMVDFLRLAAGVAAEHAVIIDNIAPVRETVELIMFQKRLRALGYKNMFEFLKITSYGGRSEIAYALIYAEELANHTDDLVRRQIIKRICANIREIFDSDESVREYSDFLRFYERIYAPIADMSFEGNLVLRSGKFAEYVEITETQQLLLKGGVVRFVADKKKIEKDLYDLLAYYGIKVDDDTVMSLVGIYNDSKNMPFAEFENTHALLASAGFGTLYEFLNVAPAASESEILDAIEKLYCAAVWSEDTNRKRLTQELCSLARTLLLEGTETRKYYDRYVAVKRDVYDALARRSAHGMSVLFSTERDYYVKVIADTLGVSKFEAESLLGAGCEYYRILVSESFKRSSLE